ncbi:DUF5348 domain-containing protein [Chakrabartyella piscis]|uniref:DUF5348 domain-containing protein n=1 Tax=Chakrabartyella piscis TaxID=2918914 RepID=UPI002958A22D|nr:DUF5348 domain-containing protein [Chakrabartyella piscis]
MITIQKALTDLKAVSYDFKKIAKQTGFEEYGDMSHLEVDYDNAEQVFYAHELNSIIDKIDDMVHRINYLNRPVCQTTTLHKNSNGRFETVSGHEYTCGSGIECLIDDDGEQEWVWASVEYSDRYYITCYGNPPLKSGMTVRIRG